MFDGVQNYRKVFQMFGRAGVLIQQVLSRSLATAWISIFEPKMETIEETRVKAPYNFRKKTGPQKIYDRNYRAKKIAGLKEKGSCSK